MRKILKYSLLITLTLLIITSLVNTQLFNAQPVNIGLSTQNRPYESNPTLVTPDWVGTATGDVKDGKLATGVNFQPPSANPTGIIAIQQFTIPPPAQQFTIGWVDIKIKYTHPGSDDDTMAIKYKTGGSYTDLEPIATGADAKFDDTGNPAVRAWANVATYPDTGAWTWTDVQNLVIRIHLGQGADSTWDDYLTVYEVWLTIYEKAPPSSSPAMSVMPGATNTTMTGVLPGMYFFADVYLNGLPGSPGVWGYQVHIKYDESVITAHSYFTYYPFTVLVSAELGVGFGNTSLSFSMQLGDTVGFTGTTTPLCRIYFQVDHLGGGTFLDLIDDRPTYITEITDPDGNPTYPTLYDGWLSSPRYLLAQPPTIIDLTYPNFITTNWHEEIPDYCKLWHLTSWEDDPDNIDGVLSISDQIDMTNESDWVYWFHVDSVTTTMNYTLKYEEGGDPVTELNGIAERFPPNATTPIYNPIGTTWHVFYPYSNFSYTFEISSWTDTAEIGIFDASDQFDWEIPGAPAVDVVLVGGPTPPTGASLSAPNSTHKYWDANTNGDWDVGETAVQDDPGDGYTGFYVGAPFGKDVILAGPVPTLLDPLSAPDTTAPDVDKYWDANSDGDWDIGEPAIRDVDTDGKFSGPPSMWAHVDAVSTGIIVSQKPIPPEPGIPQPEFPLGITLLMIIAPIIPLTYLWRLRKKVKRH